MSATAATTEPGATIAVAVLGMSGGALEEISDIARREADAASVEALFIVDTFDFAPLRGRGLVFEQVVDIARRRWSHPGYDWSTYRESQFELIGRKWRSISLIAFGGPPPQACVDAFWRGAAEPIPLER